MLDLFLLSLSSVYLLPGYALDFDERPDTLGLLVETPQRMYLLLSRVNHADRFTQLWKFLPTWSADERRKTKRD